ncbi:hypothetical protein PQX77_008086 [Marasmius sp. AFHP31]|nr:hypothetical protein PQX77_008086 [Marasmius sp. AFHP31]
MSMVMRTRTRASSLDSGTQQPLPTEPERFHRFRHPELPSDPALHPGFATPGQTMGNSEVGSISQSGNVPNNSTISAQEVKQILLPSPSTQTPTTEVHSPSAYVPSPTPNNPPTVTPSPIETPSHALARSMARMTLNPSVNRVISNDHLDTSGSLLNERIQRGRPQWIVEHASPTPVQRYQPAQPSPLGRNYTHGYDYAYNSA